MAESRSRSRLARFLAGSSTQAAADELNETDKLVEYVPVGRIISEHSEQKIHAQSQSLARIMDLYANLPQRVNAYGIMSQHFIDELSPTYSLLPLAPGWACAAAQWVESPLCIIEMRAFFSGSWFGALQPGGEHLFDEISALLSIAHSQLTTALLIDNMDEPSLAPASFQMTNAASRLRRAVPGTVAAMHLQQHDPYQPAPSPFLADLYRYEKSSCLRGFNE